jgi:hypothetical protein
VKYEVMIAFLIGITWGLVILALLKYLALA